MKKHQFNIADSPLNDTESDMPTCAKEGCEQVGQYKAPKSIHDVRDYIWFCLDHVREYNKSWNYFGQMDENGIEEAIRRSTIWERPSWKFGTRANSARWSNGFHDPMGLFEESGASSQGAPPPAPCSDEQKAFAIFGLSSCTDPQEVKKRYKELAKAHHPDANGGSLEAEERLKTINWAYAILKNVM